MQTKNPRKGKFSLNYARKHQSGVRKHTAPEEVVGLQFHSLWPRRSTELKLQDYTCTGTASFSFSFKSIFSTEFLGEPSFSSSLFAVYLPSSVTLPDLGAAAQHERMLLAPNAHETFNIWNILHLNTLLLVFPIQNDLNVSLHSPQLRPLDFVFRARDVAFPKINSRRPLTGLKAD